jgi:hypothetical protein
MHVTTDGQQRTADSRRQSNKGCRALGVTSKRIRAAPGFRSYLQKNNLPITPISPTLLGINIEIPHDKL